MPTTPDFDHDTLVREAFMGFSATPLPPSTHTSDEARSTVRRRRQVHLTVAAAAVVLVAAIPVAANALTDRPSHGPAPAGPSRVTIEPSATEKPTATASPSVETSSVTATASADVTVSAGQMLAHGSAGKVIASANVTVQNHGPATVDQVDVTFTLRPGLRPLGAAWGSCARDDLKESITCSEPAPAVGASRTYPFHFAIEFAIESLSDRNTSVTVRPHAASDPNPADNTATLTTCTNGCNGPAQPSTHIAASATKLATNGSAGNVTGTTRLTLRNEGPAPADLAELDFVFSDGVQPHGGGWNDCVRDDINKVIHCLVQAPPVGGSRTYTFTFTVDFRHTPLDLTVYARAADRTDPIRRDTSAKIDVCTNGPC